MGVGGGKPFYVTRKDMAINTVYVTDNSNDLELQSNQVQINEVHWIGDAPEAGLQLQARFRHRGGLVSCMLSEDNVLYLEKTVDALAVGQSAVLYDGNVCLGGGIIAATFGETSV